MDTYFHEVSGWDTSTLVAFLLFDSATPLVVTALPGQEANVGTIPVKMGWLATMLSEKSF